jgi:hypothetical protein
MVHVHVDKFIYITKHVWKQIALMDRGNSLFISV